MDPYGIDNFSSGSGLYGSLAGGSVPMTATYAAAAPASSNGVSWGGVLDGLKSVATTGASIYSTIANGSRKPGQTNITLLDPNTGRPSTSGTGVAAVAGNNNLLLIVGGVILIAVIGFFAFFKKGK
jgi:hypothetical protein